MNFALPEEDETKEREKTRARTPRVMKNKKTTTTTGGSALRAFVTRNVAGEGERVKETTTEMRTKDSARIEEQP